MKPGDVVKVKWEDHVFDFGESTGGPRESVTVTSVGYLVHEDMTSVRIAMSTRPDGTFAEVQTIDRRMLVWVKPI